MIRGVLRSLALLSGLSAGISPALAEGIAGADDPAFAAPFARALQGGADPTALDDLHAAAEAGNAAAIAVLPVVLQWLPPQGTLAERNRYYRRIAGRPLAEALPEAWPEAALWRDGETGAAEDLPDRAARLIAAGESARAAHLLSVWLNQTGGTVPLPPELSGADLPLWLNAMALATSYAFGEGEAARAPLLAALKADRAEAALAKDILADADWRMSVEATAELATTGTSQTAQDTARAYREAQVFRMSGPASAADATLIAATLTGHIEFTGVEGLCALRCPGSAPACGAAAIRALGLPLPAVPVAALPPAAILSEADFARSPRGADLFLTAARDRLAQLPDRAARIRAAAGTDACLAELLATP